jgi:hypothetical protein
MTYGILSTINILLMNEAPQQQGEAPQQQGEAPQQQGEALQQQGEALNSRVKHPSSTKINRYYQ